eukprot:c6880_g1_i1.p1 GENE.c6880_g1_i1~~c6880_g1_i1.p1  ORF type:complete len:331 (+),score=95.24 c6880_g1_i1:82-993(+)
MASKRAEADENMTKGDAKVKVTLTRWKPDWDSAATYYDRAATCYKNCRENELAIKAFKKLSEAHVNLDGYSTAAKALENASALTTDPAQGGALLESAGKIFMQGMLPDRASDVYVRAARLYERAEDIPKAVEVILEACRVLEEEEERLAFARDTFIAALSLLIRQKDYTNAADVAKRQAVAYKKLQQPGNVWKSYLSVIILLLASKNFPAADDAYFEFCQTAEFTASDEWYAATDLLQAFEKADEEMLQKAAQESSIQYLENSVAKVGRELKLWAGPQHRAHALKIDEDPLHGQEIKDDNDIL